MAQAVAQAVLTADPPSMAQAVAQAVLTADDLARLRDAFGSVATNLRVTNGAVIGGEIDKKSFGKLIKAMAKEDGEKPPSSSDLAKAFKNADTDNGGTVDWDEFTVLYAKVKKGEVKGIGGKSMFARALRKVGKKTGVIKKSVSQPPATVSPTGSATRLAPQTTTQEPPPPPAAAATEQLADPAPEAGRTPVPEAAASAVPAPASASDADRPPSKPRRKVALKPGEEADGGGLVLGQIPNDWEEEEEELQQRLRAFYAEHSKLGLGVSYHPPKPRPTSYHADHSPSPDPAKIEEESFIADTAHKFVGREAELFEMLHAK